MKKKKIIFIFILLVIFSLYLNRAYSRIYDRVKLNTSNSFWTNPITFRNPNFQNTVKYVSLGDSLSVGVGSDNYKKALPFTFATKLSEKMSVTLVNLAVSGATIKDVIDNQLPEAKSQKPNYVTLFIGTNDVHNLISYSEFDKGMNNIINYLTTQTSAKIIVFNIPYLGSDNLILFPYNLFFDYQIRQYNQIISRICEANDLTLIDLYYPTTKFARIPGFYSPDDFHPSGDGYLMWGSLINPKDL